MDYDSLLPEVGAFGRYQKLLIGVVLVPTVFPCAFQAYSQLFIAATPDHWCRVPELDEWLGNNSELGRQLSIPRVAERSKPGGFEQCRMYQRNYTEVRERLRAGEMPIISDAANFDLISCQHGWNYDRSLYPNTVVSEVR